MKTVKAKEYQSNKEYYNTRSKQDRLDHPDKYKKFSRKYYQDNKEALSSRNREYYYDNLEKARADNAKWKRENRGAVNAYCAKRRAAKINRTPYWLTEGDLFIITEIYDQAQQLTIATGIDHHVDHEYPLQGDIVSGLHIPENLQILLASDNLTKSNSYAA
jgi:hypothetical protein